MLLQVSATDPDCGLNAMVNYTLGDVNQKLPFEVNSNSGEICIVRPLDFETKTAYEFPVIATDRGNCQVVGRIFKQYPNRGKACSTIGMRSKNIGLLNYMVMIMLLIQNNMIRIPEDIHIANILKTASIKQTL